MELGINAATIIDSADDLDAVAARCTEGAFTFAGQICISVQRIYVKETLFDDFVKRMIAHTKKLVLGDPKLANTDVSALINSKEIDRVESWVKEAEESGALIVHGGKREGTVFQPTILLKSREDIALSCKEVFGPVVSIHPYKTWNEAINRVNASEYGLQAGVYTTNIQKAFDAVERLEVGGVMINDIPTFRADNMPYGGVKNSGLGREGLKYAIEEMTEMKFAAFKL